MAEDTLKGQNERQDAIMARLACREAAWILRAVAAGLFSERLRWYLLATADTLERNIRDEGKPLTG